MLKDIRFITSIKKTLLFVGKIDLHNYTILFGGGLWELKKGRNLVRTSAVLTLVNVTRPSSKTCLIK
jgi:hypothetical protein